MSRTLDTWQRNPSPSSSAIHVYEGSRPLVALAHERELCDSAAGRL